jgi:formate hydrogenlyase subunit 4
MVVEHLGGANRQARFSAVIRPPKTVQWTLALLAGIAAITAILNPTHSSLPLLVVGLVVMWIAPILEANRLEVAIRTAVEDVATELAAEAIPAPVPVPLEGMDDSRDETLEEEMIGI